MQKLQWSRLKAVVICAAVAIAIVAATGATPAFAVGSTGSDSLHHRVEQVRAGIAPQTRSSPSQRITFYWGLKRKDSGVARALKKASNPRSNGYRKFLAPAKIATRYGASVSTVRTVRTYLKSHGVSGQLDSSRAFMRVSGTVSQLESAFNVTIMQGAFPSENFTLFAPMTDPVLPAKIAKLVPQRLWAYFAQISAGPGSSVPARRSQQDPAVRLAQTSGRRARSQSNPPTNQGTFVGTCPAVESSPLASYTMSVQQGIAAYKIDRLQRGKRGDVRPRQPLIGVLALGEGFTDANVKAAAACVGTKAPVQRYRTDGMTGPLLEGLEGELDVQLVTAAIKGISRVPVFEALPSPLATFLGPFAALSSPQRPTVLTNSYLVCEPEIDRQVRALADSAYARLALAGTSAFSAAGDSGSSGCVNQDTGAGPTMLAVGYPASSPFTTGVGGTRLTLTKNNSIASEVVWNDSPWGTTAAGNGGTSRLYPRPWWQPKSVTKSKMLTVPDLSAHASTYPGFPVVGVTPGLFATPVYGTSAAAPLTASGFALLNARELSNGRPPLGFVNPWLYQQRYAVVRDIKVGNNALLNPACCVAKKGYDEASGMGSPNFAKLAKKVPEPR